MRVYHTHSTLFPLASGLFLAAMQDDVPLRVISCRQMMSAATAAFPGSGRAGYPRNAVATRLSWPPGGISARGYGKVARGARRAYGRRSYVLHATKLRRRMCHRNIGIVTQYCTSRTPVVQGRIGG